MRSVQLSMQGGLRNVKIFTECITTFGIWKKLFYDSAMQSFALYSYLCNTGILAYPKRA